jgi:hypothetical protein
MITVLSPYPTTTASTKNIKDVSKETAKRECERYHFQSSTKNHTSDRGIEEQYFGADSLHMIHGMLHL